MSAHFQEAQTKSAELLTKIKSNNKTYKKEKEKLKSAHFDLEKSKLKYLKSFHDSEDSEAHFKEAENDGTLARNEILRIKLESEAKHKYYIHQTEAYQSQLNTTNSIQSNYYKLLLPDCIDKLETIERERLEHVLRMLSDSVKCEDTANVIVTKCRSDMADIIADMKVESDINLVVDINKSGKKELWLFCVWNGLNLICNECSVFKINKTT